uniref:Glycine N-acyltransferase-like protein n=1 Tax=Haplochromis burtoni TaxID=8153 RepID=A0A3Q3CT24_HAPBU
MVIFLMIVTPFLCCFAVFTNYCLTSCKEGTTNKVFNVNYFCPTGLDVSHAPVLKQVSCDRRVKYKTDILVHLLYLQDTNYLHMPAINRYNLKSICLCICHMKYASEQCKLYCFSTTFLFFFFLSELESRISSLNLSHVDLVNKTWKFGGDEKGYRKIENLISNFPSCCITDSQGQPVSWILVYDYCALGMLYTLPEHRGKGYAKIVISTLAKKLHAEGYPVFCYIEEDNVLSYKLFKNMGFIEDPSYRYSNECNPL